MKEHALLNEALQRKWVKRAMLATTPPMGRPLAPVDLPVVPPMVSAPMEEDITLSVVQAPSSLGEKGR